jgi:energy-coupling factor transporter ATP-binding protein EcfA2
MSIEPAIVEWAASRPQWQRMILRSAARGKDPTPEDISALVDRMMGEKPDPQESFDIRDLPARASAGPSVRLLELRHVTNVNALLQDEPLTFDATGLTIVYGDNGSGKSGYARLIKQIVGARHKEPILTDVFSDRGTAKPAAEVVIQINGRRCEFSWPDENPPDLARIAFFDEACGDLYLSTESEVSYRPSALFVLDGLIRVCDQARDELDRRITVNSSTASALPVLAERTRARTFLETLSAQTTDAQVEDACRLVPDTDALIGRLLAEEARLRATDLTAEKRRLQRIAAQLSLMAEHLVECRDVLGDTATSTLGGLHTELARRKEAAELASNRSFDREPLRAVGTDAWRNLWEAARQFVSQSLPDTPFPPSGDEARCPLCQQELDEPASQRMRRFEAFVRDVTQREFDAAAERILHARKRIEDFAGQPAHVLRALEDLAEGYGEVARDYRSSFERYERRRDALLSAFRAARWLEPSLDPLLEPVSNALAQAAEVERAAEEIDDSTFAESLRRTIQARLELEAVRSLDGARPMLFAELKRLRERRRLEQAKESTNTQGISRKAADLTREHVTSVIRDRFTRESDRLKLERVTLVDVGGKKGALQHQPAFLGAVQRAPLPMVLSEGEQTALGLAGFFTEAHLEVSHSAIVLDDPVSSLDHVRRGYVAARLAMLAKERQVVVFTHDIAFVADLRLAAESEAVGLCERSIERRRSGQPGACLTSHPWKARDVPQRVQLLEEELARMRREMNEWDQQRYERETADWAGRLSETWERLINLEVVGKVIDRGSQEVRPRMFRVLARITEDDDRDFQASYARCSRWARRHDKSVDLNYVAPDLDDLRNELDVVRQWWDRVRRYGQ